MVFEEFLQTWYINPIIYGTGYNPVNTITYALAFILGFYITTRILKHYDMKIDKYFLFSTVPFVLFGSALRVYEDLFEAGLVEGLFGISITMVDGTVRNLILISPFIYLVVFSITIIALVFSLLYEKRFGTSYKKIFSIIGSILFIITLVNIPISNFNAGLMMLGITAIFGILIFLYRKYFTLSIENSFLILVHMFDASTTFISVAFYGYFEQHFLPSFAIGIIGPAAIFILKLIVIPVALHYIDKDTNNRNKILMKLAVLILGLGPGTRNLLRVVAGV